MSDRTPPRCYYCIFGPFANVDSYERHVVTKHPTMPGYPNWGTIEKLHLVPQYMPWEELLSEARVNDIIRNWIPKSEKRKNRER